MHLGHDVTWAHDSESETVRYKSQGNEKNSSNHIEKGYRFKYLDYHIDRC